jgi:GntR family transcriptional regulator
MSASGSAQPEFRFRIDLTTGVPVYRQIIDQVLAGIASRCLATGDQLPTVRQLAVDLSVNPNTVVRAYRELEIGGILNTQQGTGTFIAPVRAQDSGAERERRLGKLAADAAARAGAEGFSVEELVGRMLELLGDKKGERQCR